MYRLQWSWDLKMFQRCVERYPHFRGCYVQASMELKTCSYIREVSSLTELCVYNFIQAKRLPPAPPNADITAHSKVKTRSLRTSTLCQIKDPCLQ